MKETLRHKDAFNYYYALGVKRSYRLVAQKEGVSQTAVAKWSKAFGWQKRIVERDKKNGEILDKKTDSEIVKAASAHRKEIHDSLTLIRGALVTAVNAIKGGTLQVNQASDLASLTRAQAELIRLDTVLAGGKETEDAMQRPIIIQYIGGNGELRKPKLVESKDVTAKDDSGPTTTDAIGDVN